MVSLIFNTVFVNISSYICFCNTILKMYIGEIEGVEQEEEKINRITPTYLV